MISGPFFIGSLVGVGCRVTHLGPRLGTLVGTLEAMAMGAYRAHIALRGSAVKYFASDDAIRRSSGESAASGSRTSPDHIECDDVLDILEHPNPDRYAGQRI